MYVRHPATMEMITIKYLYDVYIEYVRYVRLALHTIKISALIFLPFSTKLSCSLQRNQTTEMYLSKSRTITFYSYDKYERQAKKKVEGRKFCESNIRLAF